MNRLNYIAIALFCLSIHQATWCEQPITIFCHGIVDNKNQIDRYADFIEDPRTSFDFVDAQIPTDWSLNNLIFTVCSWFGKTVNRENMYMGYGQDVESLSEQIDPDKPYILFGFSRGGTTILNYLAQHDSDNIKAIVVNATPADTISVIDDLQKSIGYTFAPTRIEQEKYFNTLFPAYPIGSPSGIQAIASIKNKHLPVFIAHAITDKLVDISSAWQLYIAFLQAGFTDVYICQLQSGQHKAYPQSPDRLQFLQGLHSFYKKYGFAYNPSYAVLDDLSNLQPTVDTIPQKLNARQDYAR